jgi:hypothetical protein
MNLRAQEPHHLLSAIGGSLVVCLATPAAIYLAADSRYAGAPVAVRNSARKLLPFGPTALCGLSGLLRFTRTERVRRGHGIARETTFELSDVVDGLGFEEAPGDEAELSATFTRRLHRALVAVWERFAIDLDEPFGPSARWESAIVRSLRLAELVYVSREPSGRAFLSTIELRHSLRQSSSGQYSSFLEAPSVRQLLYAPVVQPCLYLRGARWCVRPEPLESTVDGDANALDIIERVFERAQYGKRCAAAIGGPVDVAVIDSSGRRWLKQKTKMPGLNMEIRAGGESAASTPAEIRSLGAGEEQTADIRAAIEYGNPGDLCAIMCLFNLGQREDKLKNFALCRSLFRASGIPLIVVECAFGNDPWFLDPSAEVIQLRTSAALWQKERLINCGLARVPEACTKVAWLDADILFQNPDWALRASELLDDLAVVQLADRIVRSPRGSQTYAGAGPGFESFAAVYLAHPNAMLLATIERHGHTGFGWAARRSVLDRAGLYDACIVGGGDHVMAHAFCGDWESPCLTRMMGSDTAWYHHAVAWASRVYPLVKARLGVVEGAALHLWHGDLASRQYDLRYEPLREAQFDPNQDLETEESGCWRWASEKPALHSAVENYLARRRAEAE